MLPVDPLLPASLLPGLSGNGSCQNLETKGMDYKGNVRVTKSGRTCQQWSSNSPHKSRHTYEGDHNFCRNPKKEIWFDRVWCYTTDPKRRWEACDVPLCDQVGNGKGKCRQIQQSIVKICDAGECNPFGFTIDYNLFGLNIPIISSYI